MSNSVDVAHSTHNEPNNDAKPNANFLELGPFEQFFLGHIIQNYWNLRFAKGQSAFGFNPIRLKHEFKRQGVMILLGFIDNVFLGQIDWFAIHGQVDIFRHRIGFEVFEFDFVGIAGAKRKKEVGLTS